MTHTRYSPDLAPNDYWLIRKLKRSLDDFTAKDDEDLYQKVIHVLYDIPSNDFEKRFNVWLERMKLCVEANGNYFEWKRRYH